MIKAKRNIAGGNTTKSNKQFSTNVAICLVILIGFVTVTGWSAATVDSIYAKDSSDGGTGGTGGTGDGGTGGTGGTGDGGTGGTGGTGDGGTGGTGGTGDGGTGGTGGTGDGGIPTPTPKCHPSGNFTCGGGHGHK